MSREMQTLLQLVENSVQVAGEQVKVLDAARLRETIYRWVEVAALGEGDRRDLARYLIRAAALDLGIYPASIHDLYLARGREEVPMTFSTPAFNLRALPFFAARAMFRVAKEMDAGAFIFEIARSEIGYTDQRPAEYAANILAAAIAEGWQGPVFMQGDHFQVSASRYAADPETEVQAVRSLIAEAIRAGFFNIDIDTSTLVDISLPTVPEQQKLNYTLSAEFGAFARQVEPEGITVSLGGEIGEVGGHNTTAEELHAFMQGYIRELEARAPGKPGLSKISIQTGTSHGGVVLPDGSIAQVKLDFDTLRELSRIARHEYGLGGTVQHGASTLPEDLFDKFPQNEAIEVHLATNFMNMFYQHIPDELRQEMYAWLDEHQAANRKPEMTDEQFYYKTRKYALGPFKAQMHALPAEVKEELGAAWEAQFRKLFTLLGVAGTRAYVDQYVPQVQVRPLLKHYLDAAAGDGDVSDLAD